MSHISRKLYDTYIRDLLTHIPQPPKQLYIRGHLPPKDYKLVTIVGSRKCSEYSIQVINEICESLNGQPVSIISGMARGVDTHVHEAALRHSIHTIAVAGSGLDDHVIYPQSNLKLAHKILESGGALISEQHPSAPSRIWMFPARNRIMVGLSSLVIVIEARQKSGTLITARLATDYNRDLLVIPSSIYSHYSMGSNELIKQGAYVYTKPEDIFHLLKLDLPQQLRIQYYPTPHEQIILETISKGNTTSQSIINSCSCLSTSEIIQTILKLEIESVIKKIDGQYMIL